MDFCIINGYSKNITGLGCGLFKREVSLNGLSKHIEVQSEALDLKVRATNQVYSDILATKTYGLIDRTGAVIDR